MDLDILITRNSRVSCKDLQKCKDNLNHLKSKLKWPSRLQMRIKMVKLVSKKWKVFQSLQLKSLKIIMIKSITKWSMKGFFRKRNLWKLLLLFSNSLMQIIVDLLMPMNQLILCCKCLKHLIFPHQVSKKSNKLFNNQMLIKMDYLVLKNSSHY